MTSWVSDIVTTHVPVVPVQAPDQPANVDDPVAVAVRVTIVPAVRNALQTEAVQVTTFGDDVTRPVPEPATVTCKKCCRCEKMAVTFLAAFMFTVH